MPMEDPNSIDVISKRGEDGRITLAIIDAGITPDPAQRMDCLLKKLKAYVNAIISGALEENFPGHSAKDFKIRVVCNTRPTPEMTAISQIGPRGDATKLIPVEYEEFPEGAWSQPPAPATASEPFDWSRLPEEEQRIDKETAPLDPVLIEAGKKALALAVVRLAAGRKGFCFAVVASPSSSEVVTFCEESATAAVVDQFNQYIAELPEPFSVCVVASDSDDAMINGKKHDAILLMSHKRGEKQAFFHGIPFRRKGTFSKFETLGSLELIGLIPNLLAPAQQ